MRQPKQLSISSLTLRAAFDLRGFLALGCLSIPAHAAVLRACHPSDTPLVCRLQSVLTFLEAVAVFFAVLLIVAVLAAVRSYRRKKGKIQPDEITQDAL